MFRKNHWYLLPVWGCPWYKSSWITQAIMVLINFVTEGFLKTALILCWDSGSGNVVKRVYVNVSSGLSISLWVMPCICFGASILFCRKPWMAVLCTLKFLIYPFSVFLNFLSMVTWWLVTFASDSNVVQDWPNCIQSNGNKTLAASTCPFMHEALCHCLAKSSLKVT